MWTAESTNSAVFFFAKSGLRATDFGFACSPRSWLIAFRSGQRYVPDNAREREDRSRTCAAAV